MDAQGVLARVQEEGVRLVRFLYCDNGNIVRGNKILSNEFGVPRWDATLADLKKLLGE